MSFKFKKIFKNNFLPRGKVSLVKNIRFKVNLTYLNSNLFIYNGTFFSKRYIHFFLLGTKLNKLVMTRKFKKVKPYL